MRCGKRTQWLWICGLIGSLVIGFHVPSFAAGLQSTYNPDELTTAAGKEFYFAIFDHWLISDDSNQDFGYFHISSEKSNTVTIQSGDKILDQVNIAPNSIQTIGFYKSQIKTNKPIHITSTEPCYVNVWVHSALNNYYSETCTAASAILPVHLLGTNYVLQGIGGASPIDYSHNTSTVRIVCTSKFCVVGIAENTTIKVKAANNTKLYQKQSGKSFSEQSFSLSQGEVLYFNLNTLTPDISGTVVSADKPIAVFQGNDLTQLPTEKSPFNGVWEQARPVSSWGTEFIIPKSGLFMKNTVKITASEDNTEVYLVGDTIRQRLTTINAGETYERLIISEIPELAVHHLQTTKPVCCYIYSGSERTNGAEGPEMAEIIPMDSAATEARWAINYTTIDDPYTSRLIITTRTDNMEYVKLNGQKLSIPMYDGRTRYDCDGYSTWEIPIEPASSGKIIADEGSFSAYIVHKSSKNSVALLNIGLPFTPEEPPEPLCTEGMLLFREDFGGNDPNDPEVSTTPVPGMSYTQLKSNAFGSMGSGKYLVTKKGYRNSSNSNYSVWHIMDDHTHFDDYSRGYFMEIDGKGDNAEFYKTTLDGLCAGSKLTFSAWVANLTTATQYNVWRYDRAYVHPKLTFSILNKDTREVIAEYQTDTIAHDWSLFGVSNAWQYSANWQQVGMNFIVPEGVNAVELSIRNAVNSNAAGNDFAIDDIEIRICLPKPEIVSDHEVCQNSAYSFVVDFTNDGTLAEPIEYKWWHSADSITWTERTEFSGATPTLAAVQATDSGWYKVAIAGTGNIESVNCRTISEPFRLRVAKCIPPEPELCMDGTLLFREDFGGNDPDDPRLSTTPVEGMSYTLSTSGMGSGRYMVTKSGYCNGDTTGWTLPGADLSGKRSQWYIQDDHTYPNDYSRGYFMEIDGNGGNQQFYETEISGLCEGIELTFSAYVANVFTWFQYDWYTRNRGPVIAPCLKFVLTNPQTGETLAEKNTQEIPFDASLPAKTDWQYSSKWHLVGMNFTVPVGVNAIRLSIYNNVTNGNGNDFAIDDIEVHLCMTPDTILTDTTVCDTTRQIRWREKTFAIADTLRDTLFSTCGFDSIYYVMHVEKENCEHALCTDGILLFREDFGGNNPSDPKISTTPVPGMSYTQATTDVLGSMGAGKYLVTKQGYCNGNGTSQWHLQDDHTHFGDLTRGYFMEIDGRAGSDAFYRTTIDHLCEGIELTFSAYVANVMTWGMYVGRPGMYAYPRLKFVLTDPTSNTELATYDTGDIPFDSTFIGDNMCWQQSVEWRLVGMNFIVPVGVESVQLSIYNNVSNSNGNDFAIDDIEVHLCMTPDTIRTDTTVCDTLSQIQWRDKIYNIADTLHDTLFSTCGFDSIYYILNIHTKRCCPLLRTVTADTTVCDTLMPFLWRDTLFTTPARYEILYQDVRGCDSLLCIYTLSAHPCCPDIITLSFDTLVCDTLLPFTWTISGQPFVFLQPETQYLDLPHTRWTNCIGTKYTVHLDTFHCERLYPIIVNKYNWQLLCDNVTLRRLFPDRTVTAFQWYKDEQPIPGANNDDYSEQNELYGVFQLRVTLDGGQIIWSNIIEILDTQAPEPIVKKVYYWHGLTIIRFQQGDKVWVEKKLRIEK